jgi:hypothetical protein
MHLAAAAISRDDDANLRGAAVRPAKFGEGTSDLAVTRAWSPKSGRERCPNFDSAMPFDSLPNNLRALSPPTETKSRHPYLGATPEDRGLLPTHRHLPKSRHIHRK